ncbi:MAG: glycosyltransferase family 4 protein [Agarilytica sp.]
MSFYTLLTGLPTSKYKPVPILPDDGPMFQRLKGEGYSPQIVPFKKLDRYFAVSKVKKIIQKFDISGVYLSCAHKYTRMASKAAYAKNIEIIWHVREPPLGHRVQKSIKYMTRYNAHVVVVSKEQEDALLPRLPVQKVDNGVDIERFDAALDGASFRDKYGVAKGDIVFSLIGTVEKRKGTEPFLLAAERIAQQYENASFMVIGSDGSEYADRMKKLVEHSSFLHGRVHFTGNVWNVPEAMAASHVVVMYSTWEAFPRVVIESMAMKKMVIASEVGDVPYMIEHEHEGLVVSKGDDEALYECLNRVMLEPSMAEGMAEKAYKKALACYTQEVHVSAMEKIFDHAFLHKS